MRLIPRDEGFYDLFAEIARRLTRSAELLTQLFADLARLDETVAAIKAVEHEADVLTYQVNQRLDKSFVTPMDREDIHLLASRLDNVVDLIDGAARRAAMFRLTEPREAATRLCSVVLRAAHSIEAAVAGMKDPHTVARHAQAIKGLEEEGDAIYQEAVGALFSGRPDPLEVMKWKEVFDKVEDAIDECEDVANTLESISIKNS